MPLKKNTSLSNKDTQLLTLFQAHFGSFMNLARIRLICHFITALCKIKSVNYSKLSAGFDTQVNASSNYRRIQRFMSGAALPMEWVAKLIFALLPEKGPLVLVMDRTNWKFGESNINILMLGVCYKNVAFPLMFRMLDKRGNSNTGERIALVKDFIASVWPRTYRLSVSRPGVYRRGLVGFFKSGKNQVLYQDTQQF